MKIIITLFIFIFLLTGCIEEVRTDVLKETCKSRYKVPIKCVSLNVNDLANSYSILVEEIDKVKINKSTIVSKDKYNCNFKKIKKVSDYYKIKFKCEKKILNEEINTSITFNYNFLNKEKKFNAEILRKFGKKDPYARKPLNPYE